MPSKKKSSAPKTKVELKNLRPKKDPKGGLGPETNLCIKGATLAPKYCSGVPN
jgi:hypothetical protein